MSPLGVAGWLLAIASAALALRFRHLISAQRELVARASHELRGSLHAAGMALGSAMVSADGSALLAADLELDRAALVLGDLDGCPARNGERDFDLAELVTRQAATWRLLATATARDLRLVSDISVDRVHGDPSRVAQILGNLVSNAFEHGEGTVDVRVSRAAGMVMVEVADQGPGLPATLSVMTSRPRAGRGRRGRGLAIATDIATGLGGRLSSDGASFIVELPGIAA